MVNEAVISRLDELIGDYNSNFFKYLLYSYDLSLNECEDIISNLKKDICENKVSVENLVFTLESYFKSRVIQHEKELKIRYLESLLDFDNDFYIRFLSRYSLDSSAVDLIYNRVRDRILEDNISDFEIKRFLEYYFHNHVKQESYIRELHWISGKNYDSLVIQNIKRKYPILCDEDIVDIVRGIYEDIIDACEFKNGVRHEFKRQCMIRSEDKKALCRSNLDGLVDGAGDSFSMLLRIKGLSKSDGEVIVSGIREDIQGGLLQPEDVNGVFLTKCFNDFK